MHFFEFLEITNTIRCYKDVDYYIQVYTGCRRKKNCRFRDYVIIIKMKDT